MVVIRLSRGGGKKNPFYHVVVADHRRSRDGRFIEQVGLYNPMARGQAQRLLLEQERIQYWIGQGAQPSDRVQHLIKLLQKPEALAANPIKAAQKKAQIETQEQINKKKALEQAKEAKAAAEAEATKAASEVTETEAPAETASDAESSEGKE